MFIISKTRAVQSNLSGWSDPGRALGTVRPNPEQNSKKFALFTLIIFEIFFEFCLGFDLTVPTVRPGSNHALRLLWIALVLEIMNCNNTYNIWNDEVLFWTWWNDEVLFFDYDEMMKWWSCFSWAWWNDEMMKLRWWNLRVCLRVTMMKLRVCLSQNDEIKGVPQSPWWN